MNLLRRILGLKGSWTWACRQMRKGLIVRRASDTGECKYRFDLEGQRRIEWAFKKYPNAREDWSNAYMFMSTFVNTTYQIWTGK